MTESVPVTNNVVQFPAERIVRIPLPEEMKKQQELNHRRVLDSILQDEAKELVFKFMMAGINVQDPLFGKHYTLAIEFLRATLYHSAGFPHPLQVPLNAMAAVVKPTPFSGGVNIDELVEGFANDNEEDDGDIPA